MTPGRDASPPAIEKCAAIVIRDIRLLVVRKRGTDILISPGGKIEPGESRTDCLRRELGEELGVKLTRAEFFGSFRNSSAFERGEVSIHAYLCEVSGEASPLAEIEEIAWIAGPESSPDLRIGSVFADFVIPALARAELIDA